MIAGSWEYFIKGLPILPDGISRSADGSIWISGFIRPSIVDWMHQFPMLKKFLLSLLLDKAFFMKKSYGIVLRLNQSGTIIQSYHDASGKLISDISSVSYSPPNLLLGGLERNFLALYDISNN